MILKLFSIFYLSMMVTINQSASKEDGMLASEHLAIVNLHNRFRISNPYWVKPIAADMTAMDWDDRLSVKAKELSSQCHVSSDELDNDYSTDSVKLGRINMERPSHSLSSTIELFNMYFNKWINESLTSGQTCRNNNRGCSIIKQITYSRADRIGCGASFCDKENKTMVVCLYNAKPNATEKIFSLGEPCSNCPVHKPFCLDDSLCASFEQCQKRNFNSICKPIELFSSDPICNILIPVCHLSDTRNLCPKTCEKELIRLKNDLIFSLREIMLNDEKSACIDVNPKCQLWKEQSFCHVEKIQKECMLSCQMCANKGDIISCNESVLKRNTCLKVKNINMCGANDMQEICPITCGNLKCKTEMETPPVIPQDLEPGLGGLKSGAEPPQCKYMLNICHNEGVSIVCPKTCGKERLSSLKSSPYPTTEPTVCPLMRQICFDPTVSTMCKKTCATSTSSPSKSSTLTSTEPTICPLMKNICSEPTVSVMCKKTCATLETSRSSTYTASSTFGTTEPSICNDMKELCSKPSVSILCKKTCASTTTSKSTYSSLSIFMTSGTTEPPICRDMKELCSKPNIAVLCKKTCEKCKESERRKAMCNILKKQGQCTKQEIKMACPITCGLCN